MPPTRDNLTEQIIGHQIGKGYTVFFPLVHTLVHEEHPMYRCPSRVKNYLTQTKRHRTKGLIRARSHCSFQQQELRSMAAGRPWGAPVPRAVTSNLEPDPLVALGFAALRIGNVFLSHPFDYARTLIQV